MFQLLIFASESTGESSGGLPLGLSFKAFIIQLITFVLIFFLLKKFAFGPIVRLLDQRHKVIEDGVKLGQKMEKEQAQLEKKHEDIMRQARKDADKVIATAQKEAREITREAEKAAQHKANVILADAEVKIGEESERARHALEKDIVAIVSEATEAIVGEKVDARKDAAIIDKILKERSKK